MSESFEEIKASSAQDYSIDWIDRPLISESMSFRFENTVSHVDEFFSEESFNALLRPAEPPYDEIVVVQSNILKLDFAAFCGCLPATLASLNLSKHSFKDEGVALLCSNLRRLTALKQLTLSYCHLDDRHITSLSACFPFLQNLQNLNLEGNRITQAFDISPLLNLEDLNLNNNNLPQLQWNQMIAQLKQLPVRSVRVWRTVVDDEMMRDLREIVQRRSEQVVTFELIDVQLPNAFDGWLQTLKCKNLTISNGQNLPEQIPINTGIIHLDLSYCSLNSNSLALLSRSFFDVAQCLKYLNISGNFCDQYSVGSLSENSVYLFMLEQLEIANLCSEADAFAQLLRGVKMQRLKRLNASGNVNIGSTEVCTVLAESLEVVKELQYLDLSDNVLRNISPLCGKMEAVESLNLDNTAISLDDLGTVYTLSSMPNLKSLRLNGITKLADKVQKLVPLSLRSLSLTESTPAPEVFKALIFKNGMLMDLDLTNTTFQRTCLETLFECLPRTLRVLNLSHTKCGNLGCGLIERNGNLFEQLRVLRLAYNKIYNWGAEQLLKTIPLLKELRCLDLSGNRINEEAFLYIQKYDTSYLTELDLSHNHLDLKALDLPGKFRFLVDDN